MNKFLKSLLNPVIEFSLCFTFCFLYAQYKIRRSTINKKWSNSISKVVKSQYKVRVIDDENFNAFKTLGTNDIFITKGLLEILEDKEIIAVLLHEVSHCKQHDALKLIIAIPFLRWLASYIFNRSENSKRDLIISASFLLIMFFAVPYYMRMQELKCDSFVAKMGYGNYLKSALEKIEGNVQYKTTLADSIERLKNICSLHPEMKDRLCQIIKTKSNQVE